MWLTELFKRLGLQAMTGLTPFAGQAFDVRDKSTGAMRVPSFFFALFGVLKLRFDWARNVCFGFGSF